MICPTTMPNRKRKSPLEENNIICIASHLGLHTEVHLFAAEQIKGDNVFWQKEKRFCSQELEEFIGLTSPSYHAQVSKSPLQWRTAKRERSAIPHTCFSVQASSAQGRGSSRDNRSPHPLITPSQWSHPASDSFLCLLERTLGFSLSRLASAYSDTSFRLRGEVLVICLTGESLKKLIISTRKNITFKAPFCCASWMCITLCQRQNSQHPKLKGGQAFLAYV